jgi:hypothetical protein
MYPMFPDVVRGAQQTLMRDIMPDLQTDYAREQLGGVLLLLQHLLDRWDRARAALEEENADLRQTLAGIAGPDGGRGAPESHGGGRGGTGRPANVGAVTQSGEALIAENRLLRASLAAAIDSAAADDAERLRLVEEFIVRQLARERAAVANTAPAWD